LTISIAPKATKSQRRAGVNAVRVSDHGGTPGTCQSLTLGNPRPSTEAREEAPLCQIKKLISVDDDQVAKDSGALNEIFQ
jgi:hypothetical protein